MSLAVPAAQPEVVGEFLKIRKGGLIIIGLFGLTIAMAVSFYNILKLPPVLGMTTGLGILQLYSWYLQRQNASTTVVPAAGVATGHVSSQPVAVTQHAHGGEGAAEVPPLGLAELAVPLNLAPPTEADLAQGITTTGPPPAEYDGEFDIFEILRRVEWDTLMFFYGIIVCVGGLAQIGYLAGLSEILYGQYGATIANIAIGVISSIVDNIPVMYAVLSMNPAMDLDQWLLVTLCTGVGGSLLSIGSAAGVALMGQSRGVYTFGTHLRWTWAIALGYIASIAVHLLMWG